MALKDWFLSFLNFGGRMSGRYRDRSGSYESTIQWLASVPELAGYDDPYKKEPDELMSPHDYYRLELYKFNRALYRGDHYNAFRFAQYLFNSGMMDDDARLKELFGKGGVDVLFLAMNLFSLTTDTFADLLTGALRSISTSERDPAAQDAIRRIMRNSDLRRLIHASATTGSYKGDVVWSVHWGDPEESGTEHAFVRGRRVDTWFPTIDPRDRTRFSAHDFIYKTKIGEKTYAAIESHTSKLITLSVREVEQNKLGAEVDEAIFREVWGDRERTYETESFSVRHVPNKLGDDDDPYGDSDYGRGVLTLADELNHRLTQLGHELDKHAHLGMAGPDLHGEETANEGNDNPVNRGAGRKYISYDKDDPKPEYIEYPSNHLQVVKEEIDLLAEEIPRQMRMAPRLLGYKAGAAEEAFDTLRMACVQTLLRNVSRIEMLDTQIKWAFKEAFRLEQENKVEGAIDPETEISIGWGDGFPLDKEKNARIWQIRTGNKTTASVIQAIEDMDGVEGAKQTMEAIDEDEHDALNNLPGIGLGNNKPMFGPEMEGVGGDGTNRETPEITAGQEEPNSRVQAR